MKSKPANRVPLYITAAVLLFSISLHIISRHLATRAHFGGKGKGLGTALVEQIEAVTYDARVKLGARLNDVNYLAKNMATVFFDDVSIQNVNDGGYSRLYAPAVDDESAKKLYPRLWPWPRFI